MTSTCVEPRSAGAVKNECADTRGTRGHTANKAIANAFVEWTVKPNGGQKVMNKLNKTGWCIIQRLFMSPTFEENIDLGSTWDPEHLISSKDPM